MVWGVVEVGLVTSAFYMYFPAFCSVKRCVSVCQLCHLTGLGIRPSRMLRAGAKTTSPHNSCDFVIWLLIHLELVVKVHCPPPRLGYQSGDEALVAVSRCQIEHLALVPPLFLPTTLWVS